MRQLSRPLRIAWELLTIFAPQLLALIAIFEAFLAFHGDGINLRSAFWALFDVQLAIFCVVVRLMSSARRTDRIPG